MHLQYFVTNTIQKSTYEDIGPFLSGIIDEVMDSNLKILFESILPDLEMHIGDIIKSLFGLMFDKIALEEFYDEESDLEAYPVLSDLKNPSSSSSSSGSVIHKLHSRVLILSVPQIFLTFLCLNIWFGK